MNTEKCKKCPAQIVWAISATSKKAMPVDAAPSAYGNVVLEEKDGKIVAFVLGKAAAAEAHAKGRDLHLNHFATCASASYFRKGQNA